VEGDTAQDHISAFWSSIAQDYEAHEGNVLVEDTPEYEAWLAEVRALLPPAPGDVLDVGCGTGFMTRTLARLGHRVTAIDLAPRMLDVARREAATRGVAATFLPGDAVAPPFESATFDVVASRHLLWTLREPGIAFADWRRLLRPGGRVVAVDGMWCFPDEPADDEEAEPGPFEQHYDATTRAALPLMQASDIGAVVELLREAGFAPVEPRRLTVETVAGNPPWAVVAFA
jgi:SAM-dependent methyltransferase